MSGCPHPALSTLLRSLPTIALTALLALHAGTSTRAEEPVSNGEPAATKADAGGGGGGAHDLVERDVEGWTVVVDASLLEDDSELGRRALAALANHLQRVKYIVPKDRVEELQQLRIRLERENPNLTNMQYHPGKKWLVDNGHDPRLVKHVHIPRARDLLARRTWAKHPYVVLHELAHAYHDQVLDFDEPRIRAAYDAAKEAGIYDEVLLFTGDKVRHYALTNHKEYFAELTESYFGVNDFYPFVRAELKQHDPRAYDLLKEIWGPIR